MNWVSHILFPNGGIAGDSAVADETINLFKEKIALQHKNPEENTSVEGDDVLTDLIGCVVYGLVDYKQAISIINSSELSSSDSFKSSLVDILWFWGTQMSPEAGSDGSKPTERWTRLCSFVKELFIAKCVAIDQLKKSLELNLLVGSGLWSDETGLQKRLVRINTSLVYRQDKYNLLREETEGYSKLLTILSGLPPPPEDPSFHIKNIASVIGYFDLDPNRVMDLTLDVMEQQVWNTSYLQVLRNFRHANIAHILGFKFSQYTTSGAPRSLYILAAVLISSGLISLEQILSYLSPSLEDTKTIRNQRSAIFKSEIMSYGVISLASKPSGDSRKDNSSASDKTTGGVDAEAGDATNAENSFAEGNQIVGLLAAALLIRNWTLAKQLICMLRSISDIDPFEFEDARCALIALIEWRLELLYRPMGLGRLAIGKSRHSSDSGIVDVQIPHDRNAEVDENAMEVVSEDSNHSSLQCMQTESIDSLVHEAAPMLFEIGYHLSSNKRVFTQICRLLKARMQCLEDKSSAEGESIKQIVSEVLLPSLSCVECNPAITTLVWGVIALFPFEARFQFYNAWKGGGLAKKGVDCKPLAVVFAETKALHSAKSHLKRLSKDNTKHAGRFIAMSTHSCPLVVFDHILGQIEVYDNMIPFVVDALKYTTELAKDAMAYILLNQLRKDSNKLKPGDTHYSGWFSALSKFIGAFYKRYQNTELHGLLHYLLERMSTGESLDLLVLKELLGRMGGCDTVLEVSSQQIEGLAGGRALQGEVMGAQVKDNVNKKAARTLRETMLSSGTAIPLLFLIAQCRSNIIFKTGPSQLKLISYLYDTCQDVLMQFTDFLLGGDSKSIESVVELMPSMQSLLNDIGLAVPVAFQLVRPLIRAAQQHGEDPSAAPPALQRWHPLCTELRDVVCQHLPADVWNSLSPELYLTFWSLSLYDVFLPKSKYEAEIRRLKERYSELDRAQPHEDRQGQKQRRAEMTKVLNLTNTLKDEQDAQKKHVDLVRAMIAAKKDSYLKHVPTDNSPKTTENIMQHCVYQRVLMSPADAVFCSQFFMLLHAQETPGFSTIHFIDKTMKTIAPILFCSTEYEAGFLGFYVNDLLENCNRWIASKSAYAKEARSKCGMEKTFGAKNVDSRASHDEFLNVCKIWHRRLCSTVVSCLKSVEYMHMRSALVFLSKVAEQFPSKTTAGKLIMSCIESIEKGDLEDLKIMARSLGAILKKRSAMWLDDEVKEKKRPAPTVKKPAEDSTKTDTTSKKALENTSNGASSSKKSEGGAANRKTEESVGGNGGKKSDTGPASKKGDLESAKAAAAASSNRKRPLAHQGESAPQSAPNGSNKDDVSAPSAKNLRMDRSDKVDNNSKSNSKDESSGNKRSDSRDADAKKSRDASKNDKPVASRSRSSSRSSAKDSSSKGKEKEKEKEKPKEEDLKTSKSSVRGKRNRDEAELGEVSSVQSSDKPAEADRSNSSQKNSSSNENQSEVQKSGIAANNAKRPRTSGPAGEGHTGSRDGRGPPPPPHHPPHPGGSGRQVKPPPPPMPRGHMDHGQGGHPMNDAERRDNRFGGGRHGGGGRGGPQRGGRGGDFRDGGNRGGGMGQGGRRPRR